MKPLLITIPHAGEEIPPDVDWLQGLPENILMCDVDRFVDVLYKPSIEHVRVLSVIARCHRYVIDLNRLADDFDTDAVNGGVHPSGKFRSGVHWVKTSKDFQLIKQPMSQQMHDDLIERYFKPFHQAIGKEIEELKAKGAREIYHIDAHSMPSKGEAMHRDAGQTRAQIVVSDFLGKSSSSWFKDLVMKSYHEAGFEVAYNWPYIGGRITEVYGQPQNHHHTIQVEMNRSLYMDENSKHLIPEKARKVQSQLQEAISSIYKQLPSIAGAEV